MDYGTFWGKTLNLRKPGFNQEQNVVFESICSYRIMIINFYSKKKKFFVFSNLSNRYIGNFRKREEMQYWIEVFASKEILQNNIYKEWVDLRLYTVKLTRARLPAFAGIFISLLHVKRHHTHFTCITCSLPVKTGIFTRVYAASTSRRIHANCLQPRINLIEYNGYLTGNFKWTTHFCVRPQVTLPAEQFTCVHCK